ncbi:helix-turn-helix transcriptional regulator [Vibrio vulnificus]
MDKCSNYSAIVLMVLKEIRLERNIHQGVVADRIGKTPSAWAKIENGHSALTFDVMVGACNALKLNPITLMTLVDKLLAVLTPKRFHFQAGTLENNEDDLLSLVQSYFNSKGYEALKARWEIVSLDPSNRPFGETSTPTIVRYCIEPQFKDWIDNGAEGAYPK